MLDERVANRFPTPAHAVTHAGALLLTTPAAAL